MNRPRRPPRPGELGGSRLTRTDGVLVEWGESVEDLGRATALQRPPAGDRRGGPVRGLAPGELPDRLGDPDRRRRRDRLTADHDASGPGPRHLRRSRPEIARQWSRSTPASTGTTRPRPTTPGRATSSRRRDDSLDLVTRMGRGYHRNPWPTRVTASVLPGSAQLEQCSLLLAGDVSTGQEPSLTAGDLVRGCLQLSRGPSPGPALPAGRCGQPQVARRNSVRSVVRTRPRDLLDQGAVPAVDVRSSGPSARGSGRRPRPGRPGLSWA